MGGDASRASGGRHRVAGSVRSRERAASGPPHLARQCCLWAARARWCVSSSAQVRIAGCALPWRRGPLQCTRGSASSVENPWQRRSAECSWQFVRVASVAAHPRWWFPGRPPLAGRPWQCASDSAPPTVRPLGAPLSVGPLPCCFERTRVPDPGGALGGTGRQ